MVADAIAKFGLNRRSYQSALCVIDEETGWSKKNIVFYDRTLKGTKMSKTNSNS